MKIYPAIDIMNGDAVRLEEGKRQTKKVYGSPLEIAKKFERYVDKIHVVDLDGAFSGSPKNTEVVKRIIDETNLSIQLGGGIRTMENLRSIKAIGVENPIIGTKALEPDFLEEAVNNFSGITVSLDISPGGLAVEGWKKNLKVNPREIFHQLKRYVNRFVFTSVKSDGRLEGIADLTKFWGDQRAIYAGGVTTIEDLELLRDQGFYGAIVGKALYEGVLELANITGEFSDKNAR